MWPYVASVVEIVFVVSFALLTCRVCNVLQECYPSDRLIFNANNHASPTRVDVTKTGHIIYAGGKSDHGWVRTLLHTRLYEH